MVLTPGFKLGPYEIVSALGAGGMGEVFQARDTRLDRTVAIKVMPKYIAAREELRARFEREARTVSGLNHPNICVLYDIGKQDGTDYMVLEYLEGETLAARIAKGPLPLDQVFKYAIQMADALDRAHRSGVSHRDVKPGNVMLTRDGCKVLDFGLAKTAPKALAPDDVTLPAAHAAALTGEGAILGTPPYMAPEQYEGKEADARSDIFSFGCVLYEMVTGKRCFEGKTKASLIAAVLGADPAPMSTLQPFTPRGLERLVLRCLEKDPENRYQSMRDVVLELRSISEGEGESPVAGPRQGPWLAWTVAAVFALVAAVALWAWAGRTPARLAVLPIPTPVLRKIELAVPPPIKLPLAPVVESLAISPDGKKLVYGNADGLWLRRLDQAGPPVLLATPRLQQNQGKPLLSPFWSPNSEDVGYFDGLEICRVSAAGGVPRLICNSTSYASANRNVGGVWLSDNRIVFASYGANFAHGLYEVSADGGEPALALALSTDELDFRNISALPEGGGVLMVVDRQNVEGVDTIAVWTGKGSKKVVFQLLNSVLGQLCYAPSGDVIFERKDDAGGIWAFPFSLQKLERTGDMFRVAEMGSLPSAAADGTLAYSPANAARRAVRQMVWVDRSGKIIETVGSPMDALRAVQLSADEHRIAAISSSADANDALWLFDTVRGNSMPLTQTIKFRGINIVSWFPDGAQLLISGNSSGATEIITQPVDGFSAGQRVIEASLREFSRSGKYLFVRVPRDRVHAPASPSINGNNGLVWAWAEWAGKDTKLQSFPEGLNPQDVALSPDDSLLAYSSTETGQNEVFVVNFPGFTNKARVSSSGGGRMQWRPDGSELYYLNLDRSQLWSADIKRDGGFQIGAAAKVCDLPASTYGIAPAAGTALFQVPADAKRFLMLQTPPQPAESSIQPKAGVLLVQNWLEEFKQSH